MSFITILSTIFLISSSLLFTTNVFAEPNVIVSPSCGPLDEFEIHLNANGFFSDYYVQWNFLDPSNVKQWHGYFATNSTGGFSEDTEIEAVVPGEHTLVLYDDLEHDSIVDKNGNVFQVPITIPCN